MWYNLYVRFVMGQYMSRAYIKCTVIPVKCGISSL